MHYKSPLSGGLVNPDIIQIVATLSNVKMPQGTKAKNGKAHMKMTMKMAGSSFFINATE